MPKRISIVVIVILLILLGIFVSKNDTIQKESHQTPKHKENLPASATEHQNESVKPVETPSNKETMSSLADPEVSPQERVYKIKDLEIDPVSSIGKKNIRNLITFINSENPFLKDPEAHEPHTVKGHKLQKEASLRVYSLKRLNESLAYQDLAPVLNEVIANSTDQAIVRIAQQILEAKKKGEDYFHNVKQGVRTLELPVSQENSDHQEDDH